MYSECAFVGLSGTSPWFFFGFESMGQKEKNFNNITRTD